MVTGVGKGSVICFRAGGGFPPGGKFLRLEFLFFAKNVFFYNLFGLVTSETVERIEVPFSKHFAAVFFKDLFLQIF